MRLSDQDKLEGSQGVIRHAAGGERKQGVRNGKGGNGFITNVGREEMAKTELHESLHAKIIVRAMGRIH
jgi:hypothetical protein